MSSCPFSQNPRLPFLLFILVCLAALIFAYIAEYEFGLRPCSLCLYERFPYIAAFVLSLGGYFLYPTGRKTFIFLLFLSFLTGASLSFYHIGVERHIFALSTACGNPQGLEAQTIEELQTALLAAPVVRCDEVPFRLFGLSFTEYNFLFSLLLMCLTGISFFCKKRAS